MAYNADTFGYIIDPLVPILDVDGKPLVGGYIKVYMAGSTTPVLTHNNWDNEFSYNEEKIPLDISGRTFNYVIGQKSQAYKVLVCDASHDESDPIKTMDKVYPTGANITTSGDIVQGLNDASISSLLVEGSVTDNKLTISDKNLPTATASELSAGQLLLKSGNTMKTLDGSLVAKDSEVATAKDVVHYYEVVGYLSADSGNVTNNTNYHSFVTNYLEVSEGDEIIYRGKATGSSASVAYFDSNKTFVSSVQHNSENTFVSIEVPNGVKYCRVGSYATTSNTIIFECYIQNTNAYGTKKTLDSLSALVSVINKAVLSYSEYAGYFLKTDGHFKSDSAYHSFATDLVKVNEGDKFSYKGYATGNSSSVLFFNANKVFVSSLEYDSRTSATEVTVPSGVSFVRFSSLASASADIIFEIVFKKSREWGTKENLEYIGKVVETNLLPYADYTAILSNTTGKVTASSKYHSFVTDKIPCAEGEKYMYKGQGTGAPASAVFYDSNGDKVSTYQVKSIDGYTEVTIPSGASFVVFSSWANIGSAITFGAFKRNTIIDDLYKEFSSTKSASPLKGKKVCFIGDSITEQAKYVSAFQALSGCVVINRGKSGCSIAKNAKRTDSFVERYDNGAGPETNQFPANADVDMFICLGGINDFGNASYYDIDFGSLTDAIDKETFCGALRYFYNGMKTRYPTKPIVVASMLHSQHYVRSSDSQYLSGWDEIVEGENGAFSYKVNPKGATLPQYHDAVRDVCKMYGIPFVDMFNCGISALVESDRTNYYQDGLHPNDDGGVKMAQYLYRQICSMVNL